VARDVQAAGVSVRPLAEPVQAPPSPPPPPSALRRLQPLIVLAGAALVVACLYWAQAVLMPLALAILLSFLLTPLVAAVQRRGVHRVVAVVLVVALVFSVLGAVAWVLAVQAASLGDELPKYRTNIKEKIADLRAVGRGGSLEKVQETVKSAAGEAERENPPPAGPIRREPPTPVVVQADRSSEIWSLPVVLGPWLEPLATGGLVVVLVVFMLLERQDLRNRLLRLMGHGRLALTTKALDEAGERITRYLVMQSLINATFGGGVTLGLLALGVPYAVTWGFLAAVLRFIPYVGPWIGALLPVTLSLAVFPGWTKPLLVVALFLVLELFTNMVLETLLYAGAAGISQVALLMAVAFWTWLWGPVGLLLATPLTVCAVVFAKHVPALDFLTVMLGDAPVLATDVSYYQRLLAGDQDEAADIVERQLKVGAPDRVYDGLLLPALVLARRDRALGAITAEDEASVLRATREILDDLAPAVAVPGGEGPPGRLRLLACPVGDESNAVAGAMLAHVVDPARVALQATAAAMLSSETVEVAAASGCEAVLVVSLPPGGLAPARYLVKRLRARLPGTRLLVGRWAVGHAGEDAEAVRALLVRAGADEVAVTLADARDAVLRLAQLDLEAAAPARAGS
jgi:predicted PurR-regulated permease PerM